MAPGGAEPGVTDSGATDPGATDPGATNPDGADPDGAACRPGCLITSPRVGSSPARLTQQPGRAASGEQ